MPSPIVHYYLMVVLVLIGALYTNAEANRTTSNDRDSHDSDSDNDDDNNDNNPVYVSDDDCNAGWIQRLNESGSWNGNKYRSYTKLPPTLLDIVDACFVRALQKANMEALASRGYFSGVWKALESTHYNELAEHELLQPSANVTDGLTVEVAHVTLKDVVLDDRNGLATTDFDALLFWNDSRLDAARLKPPFDELGRRGEFTEDSIVTASVWKPQVDLSASPHNKRATATYKGFEIYSHVVPLVSGTLAFDEFRSGCDFIHLSSHDIANCTLKVVFKRVWAQNGVFMNFTTWKMKPQHVIIQSRRAHPREWSVTNATLRALPYRFIPGFSISISLIRQHATPQTTPSYSTTSTSARETPTTTDDDDGDYQDDDEDEDHTTSTKDSGTTSRTVGPTHESAFDEKPQEIPVSVSCWFYPALVIGCLAPFVGKEMIWKVAMKLLAVLLLQPGFIVRLFGVDLPAAYDYLLYFTLVSMIVDVFALHVLQHLQAGVYLIPPPSRILLVAWAIVRKFGSIAGFPHAALPAPELPALPILGRDAGGEGQMPAPAAATNYANSWVVIGLAAYVGWLGLATAVYLSVLVAYLIG